MEPNSNPINNNNNPVQEWVKPDLTIISVSESTLGTGGAALDGLGSS